MTHGGKQAIESARMSGFTLAELLVSLAIVGIMGAGIFSYMQTVYAQQTESYHLAQRTEKALIMKAALDNTVTSSGSIAAPTLSSTGNTVQNGSTPFNLFGAIGNFLYGNCPDTGLFGNIYGFLNNTTNTFLDDLFFGGYNSAHTTATDGNGNLNSVAIPAQPIAVTTSSISFDWLVVHANGGDELCQGTMQLSGNILTYTITGSAKNGDSNCGAPGRENLDTTDFPVGNGWSFSGPVQNATCMGSAYPGATPEAIVATDASAHGLNPTEVAVCLPAM